MMDHPANAKPGNPFTPTLAANKFPASGSGETSASSRPFCAVVK
jgi:hypothetical protein